MSVVTTPRTLLPLTRFAEIVGYSPMLFNQVAVADLQPADSCSDPTLQYTWQPAGGGRPGRYDIALAIQQAEAMIARELGTLPTPGWITDDAVASFTRMGWGGWWRFGAAASNGAIIQPGIEAWTLLVGEDAGTVEWIDTDGDGFAEAGRVVFVLPDPAPDISEIAVYRAGSNADPDSEIRPISVSYSGGSCTVTFQRYMLAKESLLERLDANAVDGTDDSNFDATVDIWRHFTDSSVQATVRWQPWICSASGCSVGEQTACFTPVNSRQPLVTLSAANWNSDLAVWQYACPQWWSRPTEVSLNYRCGLRGPRGGALPEIEKAVAVLALALLDKTCDCCEIMRNAHESWREDLALREGSPAGSRSYAVSREALDCPFGTTKAAYFAWRVVRSHQIARAVLA